MRVPQYHSYIRESGKVSRLSQFGTCLSAISLRFQTFVNHGCRDASRFFYRGKIQKPVRRFVTGHNQGNLHICDGMLKVTLALWNNMECQPNNVFLQGRPCLFCQNNAKRGVWRKGAVQIQRRSKVQKYNNKDPRMLNALQIKRHTSQEVLGLKGHVNVHYHHIQEEM